MKIAAAALIVFFPMLVNTVVGLRNIDPAYRQLLVRMEDQGQL